MRFLRAKKSGDDGDVVASWAGVLVQPIDPMLTYCISVKRA